MSNENNNIASQNYGLFNRSVMLRYVTDEQRRIAAEIKALFEAENNHSPLFLPEVRKRKFSERDTERRYIEPVLKKLGYEFESGQSDSQGQFPDFWLLRSLPENTDPETLQRVNIGVLEAKKYVVDLDKGDGREEKPPVQIQKYILANTRFNSSKKWGILSNGYKWRLYTDQGVDKFIEFDLEHAVLGDEEELVLFVLSFQATSFLIDENGSTLLSKIREDSLISWAKITQELEDRGVSIILDLINGFNEEGFSIVESKLKAYDVLYKLLFVLYIESKNIIPVTQSSYGKISIRNLLFQLNKVDWEEYRISQKLTKIFCLLKKGDENLPPQFGGDHFLRNSSFSIKNKFIRAALEKLTIFSVEGADSKFLDFSSLNVEVLGDIYESTLKVEYEKANNQVRIKKSSKKTGTKAHSTGTTYTPSDVVHYLVSEAFKQLIPGKIPFICDPACGSGHFLVEALRQLASFYTMEDSMTDSYIDHKRHIAKGYIFGNDANELAASLARLMLTIETMKKGNPALSFTDNIREFNSLLFDTMNPSNWLGNFPDFDPNIKGFDFVVGNPPYVKANEPGELENRNAIEDTGFYKLLYKKWDLYIPFIELARNLTKNVEGSISFVVESSVSYAPFAEALREEFHSSGHLRFVSHFQTAFKGWAFPATCFLYDWTFDGTPERRLHNKNLVGSFSTTESIKPFLTEQKEILATIQKDWQGLTIEDVCYVSKGLVLHMHERYTNDGIEKDFDDFEMNDLIIHSDKPDKEHPVRFVDVEDLGLMCLNESCKKHIEYGPDLRAPDHVSRPTFPELHIGPRILLTSSKKGRAAVFHSQDGVASQNVRIVKRWIDLKGVSSRAISKKIGALRKKIGFEGDVTELREHLENISELVPYEILVALLNSKYYIDWVTSDRRAKHNVSPDVISEFVLPFGEKYHVEDIDSPNFDLSFNSTLKKIEKKKKKSTAHILALIEELSIFLMENDVDNSQGIHVRYLDKLVSMVYSIAEEESKKDSVASF